MALRRFNTAAGVHTKTGYEPAELIDPQTPGNPMMILQLGPGRGGGGTATYGQYRYIGMCRCEGYGFQAVYSRIRYINQSVWL